MFRDLGIGGGPTELVLQLCDGYFYLARPGAHRTRHPVERAQAVENCATIRGTAYDSNFTPAEGVYRSMACTKPTTPELTKSLVSTRLGKPADKRPATNFTSDA
jgi:hypothetical protein